MFKNNLILNTSENNAQERSIINNSTENMSIFSFVILENLKSKQAQGGTLQFMNKSKLIQHYEKHLAAFREYLKKTKERQWMEDIHQLRVSIKKMRTILSLLEITSQGEFSKKGHFDLFSTLFKSCGKVRETQVNLSLVLKYDNIVHVHPYYEFLTHSQEQFNEQMLRALDEFPMQKLNTLNRPLRKIMGQYSDEMILRYSFGYMMKKIAKVKKMKHLIKDDKKLHKIRIHLKAVSEILSLMCTIQTGQSLDLIRKGIKSLTGIIGDWHDYTILIHSIRVFSKEKHRKRITHHWRKLAKQIERKNNRRKGRVIKLLNLYLGKSHLVIVDTISGGL